MNSQIEERIEIIKQFKTTLTGKSQSLENRIRNSKILGFMNFGIANLLLIYLIVLSSSAIFQIEPFVQNWHKSGLIVLITISLSLHAHFSYVEFLLLNHVKDLRNLDFVFDNRLNSELKNLIKDMNYHRLKPYWIMLPALLIFLAGILMLLEVNPYWDLLPLPVLIISILLSWRLNNTVLLVRRNIENLKTRVVIN